MKTYVIKNDEDATGIEYGYLFYYENEDKFYIEIPKDLDYWDAPLILDSFIKQGKYSVDTEFSYKWVANRIVPPDRQGLGKILKANRLDHYDERRLLEISTGRCAQDSFYIEKIAYEKIPSEIRERQSRCISAYYPISESSFLIFLNNGEVVKFSIEDLDDARAGQLRRLLSYYSLFTDVHPSAGGNVLSFFGQFEITRDDLINHGKKLPLSVSDFTTFINHSLVTSEEAAEMLSCSRQNIDDLVKRGRLVPVKESPKGRLFLKGDIEKRRA